MIEDAEVRIRHQLRFGGQTDKRGIGATKKPATDTSKQKRQQVLQIVKDDAERERINVLDKYAMQANWRTYGLDKTLQADLTWGKMLYTYSDELLKCVLNATTQTLNTPDNRLKHRSVCELQSPDICS